MDNNSLLIILVCLPFLGAALYYAAKKTGILYGVLGVMTLLMAYTSYIYITQGTLTLSIDGIFGTGILLVFDGFRMVFCSLTVIMWLVAMIYSRDYFRPGYTDEISGKPDGGAASFTFFGLLVLGATLGMVLSDDMLSAFIFFEVMSLCSYPWVSHFGTAKDMRAAASYLIYAVMGGLVTLTGILLLQHEIGGLDYSYLRFVGESMTHDRKMEIFLPCVLIILGYGAKAGMYPVHTWLAQSYEAAPACATALLSTVLSKVGVIGMAVVCSNLMQGCYEWGMMILVFGLTTMLVGGLWALCSVNIKRILAYSSMSQIGYIIVGLGTACILGGAEPQEVAARGAYLHMINHSVYKMIFFVVVGIIAVECGRNLDLNKLKGWGYHKPMIKAIVTIAVLGISGIPLLSGYVSKTYIHEGLVKYQELVRAGITCGGTANITAVKTLEILFLVGGGCTLAYMLKLYIPLFWCKPETAVQGEVEIQGKAEIQTEEEFKGETEIEDKVQETKHTTVVVYIMLGLLAVFALVCGIVPQYTLDRLVDAGADFFAVDKLTGTYDYFSAENLQGAGISIAIGLVLYFVIGRTVKKNIIPSWFSLEKMLYKPILLIIVPTIGTFFMRICDWCIEGPVYFIRKTILKDNSIEPKPHKEHIKFQEFMATGNLLAKSVSFGLIMFAAAFLVTMIYLLFAMI
ncbi:MAG: complex I subunit 5 family protein [Clostridium sp.]|nr:complex I subunit 5 family protein [Clostridium sp.]MCM1399259.1 complex I subunit 5 family protein [Clostridium sp.]MCM1459747.1 complex I subunit 5 family protein [Bacteroides sp.]